MRPSRLSSAILLYLVTTFAASAAALPPEHGEYVRVLASFSESDPAGSRAAVAHFVEGHPYSEYAPLALYELARFYQVTLKDARQSIQAYDRYFISYPEDRRASKARLGFISALLDAGDVERARVAIRQARIIHDYGESDLRVLDGFLDFTRTPPPLPPPVLPLPPSPSGLRRASQGGDSAPPLELGPSGERDAGGPYALVHFRNTPIDEVLATFSEELGVTFRKDAAVHGRITLIPKPRLLTKPQALSLLESVLLMKGIHMKEEGQIIYLYSTESPAARYLSLPADTRGAPAAISTDISPALEDVAEEWIKIYTPKFRNADQITLFLQAILDRGIESGPLGAGLGRRGLVRSDRVSNSIVVAGSGDFQDVMSSLIQKLDSGVFSEFRAQVIPLRFANAVELASKLEKIVSWDHRDEPLGSSPRTILIQADSRLNSLILSAASPEVLRAMTDIAAKLDQPTPLNRYQAAPQLKSLEPANEFMLK